MNAKEAKELSKANKRDLDSIIDTIKSMAGSGHDYATIRTKDIREPEIYKTQLVEMGYSVKLDDDYFSITW